MYLINTDLEEVSEELPFVKDWIETICKDILNKKSEDCKITMFYNYGYFVSKVKGSNPKQYIMLYDERLQHELSKVRVNVTMKIDDLMLTNRLEKGIIPKIIKTMVTEITKYKMKIEFDYHQDEEIHNSIPPIDESILSVEVIKQEASIEKIEQEYFDLDDILDKIQQSGMDSLTDSERKFLDKKSKEM